jgi:Cu-processing system permease protein
MGKIAKYIIYDIVRSKVIVAYTLFLLLASISLFNLEEDRAKSLVSLMSIVMIIVPLVSIIFSTTYFYNAAEFMQLLVAQPLGRTTIFLGQYVGVAVSMISAFFIGIGIPVLLFAPGATGLVLITSGIALTLVFTSLAFLSAVVTADKARGIGLALILWFYFSVIYDAMVLGILFTFSDYPLEKAVVALASLNPIDLGRIVILLKLDISALMGYTGAVYKKFFGGNFGMLYSLSMMALWAVIPLLGAVRVFKRKNL